MPDLNVQIRFEGRDAGIPRLPLDSMDIDSAGGAHDFKVVSIPTTAAGTQITFAPTIGTLGYVKFQNLADPVASPSNYVSFGRQSGGVFLTVFKVSPGKSAVMEIDCTTSQLYGRANNATTDVAISAVEA